MGNLIMGKGLRPLLLNCPPAFLERHGTWRALFCRASWTPYPFLPLPTITTSCPPPLSNASSHILWRALEPRLGNGSSSQSKCRFKGDALFHARFSQIPRSLAPVRLSFWNAPRSATHPNPAAPQQMEGLSCQLSVVKWGHFISLFFFF